MCLNSCAFQKRRWHEDMPMAAQLPLELGCTCSRNPLITPEEDKQHSYSLNTNRGDSGDLSRLSNLSLPCTIYLIILNHSHRNFHETMEENHFFLYICHPVFCITTEGTYRSNRELQCGMLLKQKKEFLCFSSRSVFYY